MEGFSKCESIKAPRDVVELSVVHVGKAVGGPGHSAMRLNVTEGVQQLQVVYQEGFGRADGRIADPAGLHFAHDIGQVGGQVLSVASGFNGEEFMPR